MKYNKRPLAFKVSAVYLAEQRRGSLLGTARELGVSPKVWKALRDERKRLPLRCGSLLYQR